ncbi:centromere DNA-binding protein complex CBF3 subunit [Hirsutella rhossiliensis]|uniref:Centromere DNA-binding protein complex CBF3 subunit n=1 Tax=Hirsutella rhossiliensis TaxID=111463 RepID=A0A9P8SPE7_9HYPO|nr:centromere DNA-binding protein complex CBF3 subunit [Hirsutella rhossiliensis]KAH0968136.1 centromere DNA-binding protein complex CBF3 subunit [Hirsutella rhossiliensis]
MAADDSYTAADERARAARRAGIQAKKDEQPANTTRSYAAKQREWKARPPAGLVPYARAAADGSLYSWPDGELVTPDKLAAWLKEDILLRRVVPPQKKPRAGPRKRRDPGRLPPDEWLRIQDLLLTGAAYTPQNLRTRVDLLFGHYYLLRGENRRKMELADLSLLDYPPSEARPLWLPGPSTALLWRWHVAGEPRPSGAVRTGIGSRSSSGGTASRSSYPTQLQETWRIFGAAGLIASKKTHLPRRVGAQDAETHGTSLAQISQAGRWNQSVLCQAYLTHLPRQFMRIVAGFSASRGLLARAAHEPQGGLDDDDPAADGFLAYAAPAYSTSAGPGRPTAPLPVASVLRLRPFGGPEWDEFAVAVRSTAVGAMEPNSQRLAIRLEARLDGIQGGLDALLQGKVPITFTGYFGAGVQFCRRKVIWDELLARMASGKCKEAAVAELELLRAGRSLNRLVDELKQRRRRGQDRGQGQGQIRVQVGTPCPMTQVQAGTRSNSRSGPSGAEDPAGKADRPSST